MSVRKKKGGRTAELTAKPPETAVERSIVVMDSILQLGVCEGEAGKHIILDYGDAKHAGYITITPERGLELVKELCAILGVPIADGTPPSHPDPTAKLVGPSGEMLVK